MPNESDHKNRIKQLLGEIINEAAKNGIFVAAPNGYWFACRKCFKLLALPATSSVSDVVCDHCMLESQIKEPLF